jgi:hypothetical protein
MERKRGREEKPAEPTITMNQLLNRLAEEIVVHKNLANNPERSPIARNAREDAKMKRDEASAAKGLLNFANRIGGTGYLREVMDRVDAIEEMQR